MEPARPGERCAAMLRYKVPEAFLKFEPANTNQAESG